MFIDENSQEFIDSLNEIKKLESIGRQTENPQNLKTKWWRKEGLFNIPLMTKVFEKMAKGCCDPKNFNNFLITPQSLNEFYKAVSMHLIDIALESDALITEMDSIYSRARTQAPLSEISSDVRRLGEFKISSPSANLQSVLESFNANQKKPNFISKFSISGDVTREATKRIGADRLGPSNNFASIFDSIQDDELQEIPEDEIKNVSNFDVDVDKLQKAIKKVLKSKLLKNKTE